MKTTWQGVVIWAMIACVIVALNVVLGLRESAHQNNLPDSHTTSNSR
jgi:hypothetical protein